MLKSSPEQRTVLWHDVVRSTPNERAARVHILAKEVQLLVASALSLYSDYDEDFEASIDLLSSSGLLGRDEFRLTFEDAEEDRESATELMLAIAALLAESTEAQHLSDDQRARCVALRDRWVAVIEDEDAQASSESTGGGFCTVAEVARHFDVTPQAVYRWIDKDLIKWERRPGGSYRIPSDQFERLDIERVRETSKRRPRTEAAQLQRAVSSARDESGGPDAGRADLDDPASTFRTPNAPRRTRRLGDRRRV